MKTQTIINIVFAVAFVGYVVLQRNPTFGTITCDTITCKVWNVVDADGKQRISAGNLDDKQIAGVEWLDKDGIHRISVGTTADGNAFLGLSGKDRSVRIQAGTKPDGSASVRLWDNDGSVRIRAATSADGNASVRWLDKDEKVRIDAGITADGKVLLPTKDLEPPKP